MPSHSQSAFKFSNFHGFTIVEALISITIIVLISTLSLPNLRRFNDDQQLKSDTEKLVTVLRLAQSNAQNRIQPSQSFTGCTDPLQAVNWQVLFDPANRLYKMGYICDYASHNVAITTPQLTNSLSVGVNMQLPTGCQNFVDFYQNTSYSNCFSSGTFNITLSSTKTSTIRTITVNQGGSISVQ